MNRNVRLVVVFLFSVLCIQAQDVDKLRFFEVPDSLHKARFWTLNTSYVSTITAAAIALDRVWYADYPRSRFHFFNDWAEWKDLDKSGHFFTAYFQSKWTAGLYDWAGVPRKKSIWIGAASGMVLQGILETMDGFSEEWGWSWGDIAFNTAGSALFLGQAALWDEQRIVLKYSVHKPRYQNYVVESRTNPNVTTTLQQRADELYGTSLAAIILKEYNGLTIWASGNLNSFFPKTRLYKWVNVSVGYGVENVFAGYGTSWRNDEGYVFTVTDPEFQPYRQFYLSLDIDFSRIKTRSKALKVLLGMLNSLKVPFPTLEVNTTGRVKFHPVYF